MHHQSKMRSRKRNVITRRQRLLFSVVTAAAFSVTASSAVAMGPDCGCPDCGCPTKSRNPIYRALDTVAGGVERLINFGVGRGCRTCGGDMMSGMTCDDGCDSLSASEMMMGETYVPHDMAPVPPSYSQEMHSYPIAPAPSVAAPMLRSPSRQMQPPQSAPMQMSQPQIRPIPRPQPEPHMADPMPPAAPTGSGVAPTAPNDGGSMFESLQDPFRDDSAMNTRGRSTPGRPVSYRTSNLRLQSPR